MRLNRLARDRSAAPAPENRIDLFVLVEIFNDGFTDASAAKLPSEID